MTDLCTAVPQLRTPAAIEEKKPPPPPDDAAKSWSLDPIAGDLRGQRGSSPRRGGIWVGGYARVWERVGGGGRCYLRRGRRSATREEVGRQASDGDVAVWKKKSRNRSESLERPRVARRKGQAGGAAALLLNETGAAQRGVCDMTTMPSLVIFLLQFQLRCHFYIGDFFFAKFLVLFLQKSR